MPRAKTGSRLASYSDHDRKSTQLVLRCSPLGEIDHSFLCRWLKIIDNRIILIFFFLSGWLSWWVNVVIRRFSFRTDANLRSHARHAHVMWWSPTVWHAGRADCSDGLFKWIRPNHSNRRPRWIRQQESRQSTRSFRSANSAARQPNRDRTGS